MIMFIIFMYIGWNVPQNVEARFAPNTQWDQKAKMLEFGAEKRLLQRLSNRNGWLMLQRPELPYSFMEEVLEAEVWGSPVGCVTGNREVTGWWFRNLSITSLQLFVLSSLCCWSFAKLCLMLCDPMDCSTPFFPVLHYFLKFAQTHVSWVSDAIQSCHPLSPPSPPALNLSQHQGLF